MDQCSGQKRDGSQCTVTVNPPQRHCWWHDPANARERQRAVSKGGRSKASKPTKELHTLLEDLTDQVIAGELETARGAVANQLISTRIRLLEFERKLREIDEIEEHLELLEQSRDSRATRGI